MCCCCVFFFCFFYLYNTSLHMQNILLAKHIQRRHIHVLLAARERSFDPVAFNISISSQPHSLTESMDRICSLKTMLCIIVPESHSIIKPLGDLNKYPLLAEQLFRTAVSSVHQRRRSKTINEFWNSVTFFFLRWILKLILKMSQNKTEITHKFKLCTTFQTRKKEAFACWSKIYFF